MKKSISLMAIMVMFVMMTAGTKVDAKSNPVSFSKKYISMNVGNTKNMKSLLKNTKRYTISWRSSNGKIATVNKSGKVTAKKSGTATIKAYIKQTKKTVTCKVKVNPKKAPKKYRTLRVKCTAYCPCRSCSGGYGNNTASGKKAKQGRTIAVDRRVIPLGSKVVIDGHTYIAEDTGVRGNTIDIYMNSHSACLRWGVRYRTVKIYR